LFFSDFKEVKQALEEFCRKKKEKKNNELTTICLNVNEQKMYGLIFEMFKPYMENILLSWLSNFEFMKRNINFNESKTERI